MFIRKFVYTYAITTAECSACTAPNVWHVHDVSRWALFTPPFLHPFFSHIQSPFSLQKNVSISFFTWRPLSSDPGHQLVAEAADSHVEREHQQRQGDETDGAAREECITRGGDPCQHAAASPSRPGARERQASSQEVGLRGLTF